MQQGQSYWNINISNQSATHFNLHNVKYNYISIKTMRII